VGLANKIIGKALEAEVRKLIREEARAEIEAFLNPTFVKTMTKGLDDLTKMMDVVNGCDDRLERLEREMIRLEKIVTGESERE
jgi:hypothetical protein